MKTLFHKIASFIQYSFIESISEGINRCLLIHSLKFYSVLHADKCTYASIQVKLGRLNWKHEFGISTK